MASEFILAHGEEYVQCPYNVSHLITNARLLTHLKLCRQQYLKGMSDSKMRRVMRVCRHNAEHHIPAIEVFSHEERCPDAHSVVRHMAYHNSEEGNAAYQERQRQDSAKLDTKPSFAPKGSRGKETKPNVSNDWGLEDEDWESETTDYKPGYDPNEKLKKQPILYVPAGLPRAERKQFRKEVREKAAEVSVTGHKVEFPIGIRYEQKPDIKLLRLREDVKDERQYKHEMSDNARHSATSKKDPDNDSYYSRDGSSRDRDFSSSSYDRDRDRNQRRSSTKDRDNNHPSSSRKDPDRDSYYARNHSPDHDSYYARHPGNDYYRSEETKNERTSASSSRGTYSGKSQQMNGENKSHNTWLRHEKKEFTEDDFEGYDPFCKRGIKN
ncbi:unnamed protein product [Orchesella dallaii]|uniref:CHHC U11-48K-type domain-containing protein n=1 Tax=Orchesella dallaii TaxID=48710 RepID=A0ABP1QA05_9HEXA